MKIPFYKCNSKGNSFIIIFSSTEILPLTSHQIQNICNSTDNQKVDGLILLNISDNSNIATMNYFNNDGSWETFCLNGMICCSLIIKDLYNDHTMNAITSNNRKYYYKIIEDSMVEVQLDNPVNLELNKLKTWTLSLYPTVEPIKIDDFDCNYINSGAKHIVIKFEDDKLFNDDLNLEKILKKIRYNKLFLPDGVNVNIYRCKGRNAIQVKTYEKGIEAMMSSCSSGSYACAYHYFHYYGKPSKIKIFNDGGTSEVVFKKENEKNLFLSKGEIEYKGELDI